MRIFNIVNRERKMRMDHNHKALKAQIEKYIKLYGIKRARTDIDAVVGDYIQSRLDHFRAKYSRKKHD